MGCEGGFSVRVDQYLLTLLNNFETVFEVLFLSADVLIFSF